MYEDIHTYKDEQFYGESYDSVADVLTFKEEEKTDVLKPFSNPVNK